MKIALRRKGQRGTTLVEVIVATAVLGIMAGGVIGSFGYGFGVMQMARENQRATQLLVEKAETIRLYRWDQILTPGFVPASFTDVYDPQAPVGSQGVTYDGRVTIGNVGFSASYSTNMREIVVSVTWTNGRSLTRTRSFSTLVAKDGIQNYVY